jgi:hypothetical protein
MVKEDLIFSKCPVDKTPDFKVCQMCEECAILRAWKEEHRKPSLVTRFFKKIDEMIADVLIKYLFRKF